MKIFITLLVVALLAQPLAAAQVPGNSQVWKTFAEKLDAGARIKVRLQDGRRVSATLVQAGEEALLIQPRTRVPVPVQPVPYDTIASIEREAPGSMSPAKAAAIGVGAGAATFLGIFFILVTNLD
ncbi:MAG: hypothetical protein ACREUE_16305 [Panacagrimonas sp.]